VVTVAHISGGSTNNVIPDSIFLEGTLRTLSAAQRADLIPAIGRLATSIAAAHGLTAEFEHDPGYPMTVNDPGVAAQVLTTAADLLGAQASLLMRAPLMGAEDFSYVLDRVPGVMAFLGACPPGQEPESAPPNHSNLVVFDEEPLPAGVALYARMAMQALAG
jgi:hippurate hydrolase